MPRIRVDGEYRIVTGTSQESSRARARDAVHKHISASYPSGGLVKMQTYKSSWGGLRWTYEWKQGVNDNG